MELKKIKKGSTLGKRRQGSLSDHFCVIKGHYVISKVCIFTADLSLNSNMWFEVKNKNFF